MSRTYNGRFFLPEEPKPGTGWLVVGLLLIPSWPSLITMAVSIGCFIKYGKQAKERNLLRRFHEYCAVIGWRGRVPLKDLKQASPSGTGIGDVRRDVQQMVSRGYFGPEAFIDLERNDLVLPDMPDKRSGRATGHARTWRDLIDDALDLLQGKQLFQEDAQAGDFDYVEVPYEAPAQPKPAAKPKPEPKVEPAAKAEPAPKQRPAEPGKRTYAEELERTLNELYRLNEGIEDADVSSRIDRIGTLTAGIFRAVIERPEREQDVRKFMNYYLPTTLKLLRSYDMLEDQKVQSQNIVESRKKIEDVLDMLIQAFERQLDRLYKDDALDIAAEVDVLESMMAGDGLSSKLQFPT